jgi:hypothetical protein
MIVNSPTAIDINEPRDGAKTGARLPEPVMPYSDAASYLAAMKATIEGMTGAMDDGLAGVVKALGAPPTAYSFATMSFMPDPANAGLLPWPGVSPESLRKIARENLAPQIVIRSRVADMARYSGHSTHIWDPGWQIGLRDKDETASTQDKQDIRDAERFVWNCNRETSYSDARTRDAKNLHPFDYFLRAFADDTHTCDGWAVWTDMDRAGRIKAYANLPAANIRMAVPGRGYNGDPNYFCALVDDTGNPVRPFTRDEMFWAIRNPRNDPSAWGYGWSEIEIAILAVQAFQGAIQLNSDTFQRNSIPNGMLLLKGDFFNQTQIDALMREWTNMKRGISKVWGMPVMSIPEEANVEVLDFMDMKGQEIRYKDHLNLMGGLYCTISQFPIRRVGLFASGHQRDNAPVPNESTEVAGVDDPGLPPLLNFVANKINEYLLWPNWPKLKLWFNGASPKQDARAYEERQKSRTWKESRTEAGLPALDKGAPKELKPILDIMQYCPEDPAKTGVFQTVATKWLEMQQAEKDAEEGGPAASGKDTERVGAPFPSKTDPAESQAHGHRSGVRRSSREEEASAAGETVS